MTRLLLPLVALLLTSAAVHAQSPDGVRRIVLLNGDVYVGTIADETADPVVVVTASGVEQRIPRAQIAEISPLLSGRFTRYDPARTRLFVSPTARSLGSGAKRFSAYYIFPSLAFGVSDRVDLSLGSTIPLVSSDGAFVALNGNVKATVFQDGGVAAAVGASATVPLASGASVPGAVGTVYALATFGSPARAVTVGVYGGYVLSFQDGDESDFANGTALLVGFESQISDRFKFVSENYAVLAFGEDDTGVLLGTLTGIRFFGDQLAADVAVAIGAADGQFSTIPIPYLGLSYTF